MCIFAGEVQKVANTRIFASARDRERFIAYQMEVGLAEANAMILPVPTKGEVELVDMSPYSAFFQDLEDALFPKPRMRGMSLTKSSTPNSLPVHRIGSYEVSIAPDVDSIDRINPEVFTLSPNTKRVLSQHYAEGYAFIVCHLVESGEIHPLGFKYIADDDKLFIPTRHEHGSGRASWDHEVYLAGVPKVDFEGPSKVNIEKACRNFGAIHSFLHGVESAIPSLNGVVHRNQPFRMLGWVGHHENADVVINLT